MSHVSSPSRASVSDGLVVRLDAMLADLAAAVADTTPASDADRIDRIARLEKLQSSDRGSAGH